MTKKTLVKHDIQKYILSQLVDRPSLRFRDMRPPRVETNSYSYHIKLLQKNGLIKKEATDYSLTLDGMVCARQVEGRQTDSPDVKVVVVIQDGYGGTLMTQNHQQPFINSWTLPRGVVELDDNSLMSVAQRIVVESGGPTNLSLDHVGDCYIRIRQDQATKLSSLVHVFYAAVDEQFGGGSLDWIAPHKVVTLGVEPGIDQVIARTFFRDRYFFEEFEVDW